MRYFKKEIFANRLMLPTGQNVPFELFGSDTGLLSTADQNLIKELEATIARKVGGVLEITEVEYEELKKNPPVIRRSESNLDWQALQRQLQQSQAAAGAVADSPPVDEGPPAPLQVEKIPVTVKMKNAKQKPSLGDVMRSVAPPPAPAV